MGATDLQGESGGYIRVLITHFHNSNKLVIGKGIYKSQYNDQVGEQMMS